ncbi:MAG: acyl-CoA desaturase [Verrucomicrobia bacterium]|nr:acyl-CoA desaturase [Verrucomicrobiota bacterium]
MTDTATAAHLGPFRRALTYLVQWFDTDYGAPRIETLKSQPDKVDWVRAMSFVILHVGCLGVIWTGWSWFAVGSAVFLYFIRMFAVTGFYHRYFSHRTFSTSRAWQFVLALWGATCVQKGALWWAYTHRHHHQHSDEEDDKHSPRQHGFMWSHIGWITSRKNFPTDYSRVKDLAKFPELVFLNRFDTLVPIASAVLLFVLGRMLEAYAPGLHTSGGQMLVWGFFISTTALFHGTSCINSMAHVWGQRRYETGDDSRNSFILSLITLGEGWHNNHHKHMTCTRQGFYWWEVDITYYLLKVMSWTGLIWDLRPVPSAAYDTKMHLGPQPKP